MGYDIGTLLGASFLANLLDSGYNQQQMKKEIYSDEGSVRYGYNLFWRYGESFKPPGCYKI